MFRRWREHLTSSTLRSYLGPGRAYYNIKPAGSAAEAVAPAAAAAGGGGLAGAPALVGAGIDNPDQR
jgi:hypothetical protein